MSEPLDYATPRTPTPRRWSWVPIVALALVLATPAVYANLADWTFVGVIRDFGLRLDPIPQRAIDALHWYGPGYGWIWATMAAGVVLFLLPRLGRLGRVADARDAAIWLLAACCLSLLILLTLVWCIEVGGWNGVRKLILGISSGGARATTRSVP